MQVHFSLFRPFFEFIFCISTSLSFSFHPFVHEEGARREREQGGLLRVDTTLELPHTAAPRRTVGFLRLFFPALYFAFSSTFFHSYLSFPLFHNTSQPSFSSSQKKNIVSCPSFLPSTPPFFPANLATLPHPASFLSQLLYPLTPFNLSTTNKIAKQ